MDKLFKISNYRDACRYLQEKYDVLGCERRPYYILKPGAAKLTKNGKSYTNKGLQYHHICEDKVANLCDDDIAINTDLEYQSADNMCYCNLLEHLYLHMLIAEQTEEKELGIGGCALIIKDILKVLQNSNVDERYNYGYVLSNNIDTFYALVNNICTSAIIRSKLNMSAREIFTFLGLEGTILDIDRSTRTLLKDHNIEAFAQAEVLLRTNRSVILQICTCGGKTTSGLEYCRLHNVKALVLTPNNTVKGSWADSKYVREIMNYQTFMNCYRTINYDTFGVVICDEVHHADAERWGEGLQFILDETSLKILGLTATPTTLQQNGDDKYFGGRICYGLDVADGIREGVFFGFDYYQAIFEITSIKAECEKYGERGKILYKKLELASNRYPIVKIVQDKMPAGIRKCIVFISCKEDEQKARDLIKAVYNNDETFTTEDYVRFISSDEDKVYNEAARQWFNKEDDHDKYLITVNMVNEGAHYDGVNTAIMLRKTNSTTLYLQQLGRVVRPKRDRNGNDVEDPRCVVFDFTNNIENLIVNKNLYKPSSTTGDYNNRLRGQLPDILNSLIATQHIVMDCSEDIVNKLAALKASNDSTTAQRVVYNLTEEVCEFDGFNIDELLSEDWGKAKTKHAASKKENDELTVKKNSSGDPITGTEAPVEIAREAFSDGKERATKAEQLYIAMKLILNRLSYFNTINVDEEKNEDYIEILDAEYFKDCTVNAGIKNVDVFKKILNKLTLAVIWNMIEVK